MTGLEVALATLLAISLLGHLAGWSTWARLGVGELVDPMDEALHRKVRAAADRAIEFVDEPHSADLVRAAVRALTKDLPSAAAVYAAAVKEARER